MIGHTPKALASKLFTLTKERKVYRVNTTISGKKSKASEGTSDGGIEIPCKIFFDGPVVYKTLVRNKLRR